MIPLISKTYNLNLDMKSTMQINSGAEFVVGDTKTNIFNITLNNKGQVIDLSDTDEITVTFKKLDNNVVVGSATVVDATTGNIAYTLGTQELTYPGKVYVTIELYGQNNEKLTSPQFYFNVRGTLDNQNAITSTTEYGILTQLINEVHSGTGGTGGDGSNVTDSATNGNIVVDGQEIVVYQHPSSHLATIITQDSTHRFATDTEKATWNGKSTFDGNYNNLSNKPTIPTSLSSLTDDSTHRLVTDVEKAAWNAGSGSGFSGNYNDLTNKPTIPSTLASLNDDSTHRLTTDTDKTSWNGAATNSHTHANKTTLDTYTQTEANLASAVLKTHDAVTVLDTNTLDLTLSGQQISGLVLAVKDQNITTGVTQIKFWTGTNDEYTAIGSKDSATLYFTKS